VQTAASGWAASNAPQLKTASSKWGETMKRRGLVSLIGRVVGFETRGAAFDASIVR
jgi:hypothetical protein